MWRAASTSILRVGIPPPTSDMLSLPCWMLPGNKLEQLTHLTGQPHVGRIQVAERLLSILGPSLAPSMVATTASTASASRTGKWPGRPMEIRPELMENRSLEKERRSSHKVLFNATGARAIESAWKAAAAFRPGKLLSLAPSFHGRSIATSALSSSVETPPAMPLSSFHVQSVKNYPYCAGCPLGLSIEDCGLRCGGELFELLEDRAGEFSAVLVEPALGARGYVFPPAEYLRRIRQLTQQAGVLMIADEIQTGLGRCGDWLLSSQQGWQADLVVLGKSLGGGIAPLSAVVGRAEILDAIPAGGESETFAATPLACAIAMRVLDALEQEAWMDRGQQIGEQLRQCFRRMLSSSNALYSVEGQAACCVLEFMRPDNKSGLATTSEQAAARSFALGLFEAGILVHLSGPQWTRIVMLPTLTMTDQEFEQLQSRLVLRPNWNLA